MRTYHPSFDRQSAALHWTGLVLAAALIASFLVAAPAHAIDRSEPHEPDVEVLSGLSPLAAVLVTAATAVTAQAGGDCDPGRLINGALTGEVLGTVGGGVIFAGLAYAAIAASGVGLAVALLGVAMIAAARWIAPGDIDTTFNDCIRDPLDDACASSSCAEASGHPNVVTLDGLGYVFHGAGDYLLAASTDDDFEIHVRFSRFDNMTRVSYNRAVAVRLAGSLITVGDLSGLRPFDDAPLVIDGVESTVATGEVIELPAGEVRRGGLSYIIEADDGTTVLVPVFVGGHVELRVPTARHGSIHGLFGDADGDPSNDARTAEGDRVDLTDFTALYESFARSWRLDDSLITHPLDPVDDAPVTPTADISLGSFAAADRDAAEQICRRAGLQPGAGLTECMIDVLLTGDPRWAIATLPVAGLAARAVPAAVFGSTVEDRTAIELDRPVTGELQSRNAIDEFVLTIDGPVRLALRADEPCGGATPSTLPATVFGPDGSVVGSRSLAACGTSAAIDLPVPGQYVIRIADTTGLPGRYGFTALDVDSGADEAVAEEDSSGVLTLGIPVVSASTAAAGQATYTFEAVAGQRLQYVSGLDNPCWPLVIAGPAGTELVAANACQDVGPILVTESGDHTLTFAIESARAYEFTLFEVPDDTVRQLALDTEVRGTIAVPGEVHRYSFDAAAGTRVQYVGDSAMPCWPLVITAPDDTNAAGGNMCFDEGPFTLPVDGTYTVVVDPLDGDAAPYGFSIFAVPDEVVRPLVFGSETVGRIGTPGEVHRFTFTGSAGQRLQYVDLEDTPCWPLVIADAFDENVADGNLCFDEGPFTLPADGDYSLVVDPLDGDAEAYAFAVFAVPDDRVSTLVPGVDTAGVLDTPGQVHRYTFTGVAGQEIGYTPVGDVPCWPLVVVDPAGENVSDGNMCFDEGPFTLPADGEYSLVVDPLEGDTGPYGFRVTLTG